MKRSSACLLVLAGLAVPSQAFAHGGDPTGITLEEEAPGSLRVTVDRPLGSSVEASLPAVCVEVGAPETEVPRADRVVSRRLYACGSLVGEELGAAGLSERAPTALLRVRAGRLDGGFLLTRARPRVVLAGSPGPLARFGAQVLAGVEHLATGLDHVLFLALMTLAAPGAAPAEDRQVRSPETPAEHRQVRSPETPAEHRQVRSPETPAGSLSGDRRRWSRLSWVLAAFALGHAATLALGTYGVVRLPGRWVEVAIAATLVWLALRVALASGAPSPSSDTIGSDSAPEPTRRLALTAGAFGLVHGLGFAAGLRAAGLPRAELPLALLGFNAGIELAQLGVVAAAAVAWRLSRRFEAPAWTRLAAAAAVGCLAASWVVERLFLA